MVQWSASIKIEKEHMKKTVRVLSLMASASVTLFMAGCSSVDLGPAKVVDRSSYQDPMAASVESSNATILPGGVKDSGRTHTVEKGDTLYNISVRHGLNPAHLAQLNMITDPTQLSIGQVLRLPESVTAPREYVPNPSVRVSRLSDDADLGGMPPAAPIREAQPVKPTATTNTQTSVQSTEPAVTPSAATSTPKTTVPAVTPGQRMIWPVRGKVLSTFAQNRKGIDIASVKGDVVVSAMQGEVIWVGKLKDYGNLMIVKHSPTMVTAYAHLDRVVAKQGTKVKSGQKIAEVGTDADGVSKLRFEVRDKGKPVDPMGYLNKR